MAKVLKGIKLRLYPNQHQVDQLWQMFGNNRFVWNQMLAMAKEGYRNNPSSHFVNEYGMNYLLKPLKQEYPFLKQNDSTSLQVVNHDLAQSFKMLFKHQGGYPRFKSKWAIKQSYTGRSICQVIANRRMKLPKLGSIRTSKTGRVAGLKIKRYTINYDSTGRYYLSLQVEVSAPQALLKTGKKVGLDVGIANLAISSDGIKYKTFNAKWLKKQAIRWQSKYSRRRHRATIAVRQWNHNHKTLKAELDDYQNWQRARIQKARYQQRIANRRKDYLHKLTTNLVKQYDVIVIEDLKTKNLQHNHHLAKAIANASWYDFRTMLAYKCAWHGKELIVVKPNYTSQICSNCGHHSGPKPLAVREWTCSQCGTHHDRDINAAVNILHKGLKAGG
ncbi:RNA-guided endonuclease TnpB family protein [Limosilactobacillus pontis]|uniref:RNA-guided endonuclease TnpB family protein n=1 Tax=Limosilactobacillus pontis TaxID=35787 RepID=UPI0025A39A30|nr:RNA-guided endonuclease TnpB family protein [Limosilactobacillus pontis]MDM8331371.1 RNA-guided endonuclease TnpB family protein [Limosilactobacillus pontis]